MINTFQLIRNRYQTLVFFITFLAFGLSLSCAQKQSAIERLIINKPSRETKRKIELAQKISLKPPTVKEKELPQTEKTHGKSKAVASQSQKAPTREQKIKNNRDSFSQAISEITLKSKKTNKDRKVQKFIFITRQSVSLRERPDKDSAEISKSKKGDNFLLLAVTEEQEQGPWFKIRTDQGTEAYVWSEFGLMIERYVDQEILPAPFESNTPETKKLFPTLKKVHSIPEPRIPQKVKDQNEVSLNFENTDIRDIIITFCELLKVDYILDPGISGKITLQTYNKVKIKDLFHILEKILILNNFTVVKTGKFFRFMPISPAKKESLNIFFGKDGDLIPARDRLIIQIVPLEHISTSTAKSVISPLLSKHASFLDIPDINNLVLIDSANNIKRILEIIEIIDVDATGALQIKLFPLKYSDVTEFAADIEKIFDALGFTSKSSAKGRKSSSPRARPIRSLAKRPTTGKPFAINIVPIEKINSLLIVNPFPELLPDIKYWISKLDRPTKIFIGKDKSLSSDQDGQIIQIIPLNYVTVDSMKVVITPLLSKLGKLFTVPNKNNLIVFDIANNIRQILEIISILDVNSLDKLQVKLFPLEFSDANEIAEILVEIFGSLGYTGKGETTVLKFLPLERLNSLLIVSHFPKLLPNIEFWISKLDKPAMEGLEERTYIYYVQNAKADALAGILTSLYQNLYDKKKEEKGRKFRTAQSRTRKDKIAYLKKEKKGIKIGKPGVKKENLTKTNDRLSVKIKNVPSEEITGEILIIPDMFTNALIIHTLPRNYPSILHTIKQLDLMPLQVLIEVLVVELAIDDQTRAGFDWAFKNDNIAVGSLPSAQTLNVGSALGESATALLSHGFSILRNTKRVATLFQALAEDSKLNVLSNPILITSENMPASITITDDIPIETTTITSPTAGQPLTETTIQYKSVGIKLNITPLINKERFVNLLISQEISNVNEAASFSQPAFFTRTTNTNVVVKDKQTLVIGGLMSKTKSLTNSGIPILKDIPFFGHLFKSWSTRTRKNELMIFITPHVIANVSEANDITQSFQSKLIDLLPAIKSNGK